MSWERLAHVELSGTSATIDTGTFTAKQNLKVIVNYVSVQDAYSYMRFNGTTGNEYSYRKSHNGGTDSSSTAQPQIDAYSGHNNNGYDVFNITNIASKPKLVIGHFIGCGSGADSEPTRRELVGKWDNTSDSITKIVIHQGNGSNVFSAGSYITVFGASDDTVTDEKTTLTDVETGTRYEETDTRKIYRAGSVEPVFHYKFDEASGDVINHGSVASADLTVTSLTRDQSTPSGLGNGMKTTAYNTGYAQNTSRVNDYKFLHDGTSKWSITFWLKAGDTPSDSTSTERMVFGNIWTDDNGIGCCIRLAKNSDNSSSVCRIQTLIADGDSGMPLNDQTPDGFMPDVSNWHFYCITYDPTLSSNNLTVSRDATTSGTGFHQSDEDNDTYSSSNPTRKFTYFARPTSSYDHGIVGTLAQVTIWKGHILTQAEKVSLYASGNGTTTLPSPLEWKERGSA